jgi:hypothetical protein
MQPLKKKKKKNQYKLIHTKIFNFIILILNIMYYQHKSWVQYSGI